METSRLRCDLDGILKTMRLDMLKTWVIVVGERMMVVWTQVLFVIGDVPKTVKVEVSA